MNVCEIKVECNHIRRNEDGAVQHFDSYTTVNQIARGQQRTVYKVKNEWTQCFVLKEIDVDCLDYDDMIELLNLESNGTHMVTIESDAVKEINILRVRNMYTLIYFATYCLVTAAAIASPHSCSEVELP